MTDTQDKPNPPNGAARLDELLTTIRDALAPDAAADARATGATACRAILGVLDPTSRASTPSAAALPSTLAPSTPQPSTSSLPIASLLGAIGQIPREQLVEVIGGLRWLLGQQGPAYLTRPAPARSRGDGP